ncbi:MAG TPA: BMP family ABC transporter substrate-binding protein [Candidatus Limnocylindrales bacterium]
MLRRLQPALAAFVVVGLLAACSNTGSSPSASAAAPSQGASASAPASPASPAASSNLKIGVVTDIGTLDDKNYNEYSYKGAQAGAQAIGAANPPAIVPKDASEYGTDIQSFVSQKFDIIITVGFALTNETVKAAKANPTIKFIGVDQSPICVDAQGNPDTTFKCAGDAKTVLPNYTSIYFAEDQAGYLAGIISASASKSGIIGAIGGTTLCQPCNRYINGYIAGAQSVNPNIKVKVAYVTHDFSAAAFNDPVGGKNFGQSFISTNKPDVLFQVAGKTGNGVLDAACAAGIWGVGVDVDQYQSYPNADKCIITSAEKKLVNAVSQTLVKLANGGSVVGDLLFNAQNDGVGASPMTNVQLPDVQAKLDTAFAAMKAGTLKTCSGDCNAIAKSTP